MPNRRLVEQTQMKDLMQNTEERMLSQLGINKITKNKLLRRKYLVNDREHKPSNPIGSVLYRGHAVNRFLTD